MNINEFLEDAQKDREAHGEYMYKDGMYNGFIKGILIGTLMTVFMVIILMIWNIIKLT